MSNIPPAQQIFPPAPKPEVQVGTTEHDSASEAYVAALIVVALTLIAIVIVVTAALVKEISSSNAVWAIVGGICGTLGTQLNAPSGIASVIASAAKSMGMHK